MGAAEVGFFVFKWQLGLWRVKRKKGWEWDEFERYLDDDNKKELEKQNARTESRLFTLQTIILKNV